MLFSILCQSTGADTDYDSFHTQARCVGHGRVKLSGHHQAALFYHEWISLKPYNLLRAYRCGQPRDKTMYRR